MARPAFRAQLTGDKAMKRTLMQVASDKGMRKEARAALKTVGGRKLEIAKSRVKVRTGKLLRSGRLYLMVSPKREDLRIAIAFGGASYGVLYARKVHETHPTHSRYLVSVIMEAAGSVGRELGQEIDLRRAAKGGA